MKQSRLKPSVAGPRAGIDGRVACNEKVSSLRKLLQDESGQDMIEYALVAALVGLSVLAAMKGLKNTIGTTFNGVGTSLANA